MKPEHDGSYKQIFSHSRVVEDLLKGFIHEDWIDTLDYGTLEKVNGSYVSEDLKNRSDDVVWRIKLKHEDRWLYLYLLIEFQSTVDPWMALRVMVYVGLLYQDLIKSGVIGKKKGQLEKLPAVFPMVIYNGEEGWTAKQELYDLIEPAPAVLSAYLPKQKYWVLDESNVPDEDLPASGNTVAEIIRLENSPEPETMQQVIARLTTLLAAPEHATLRRALTVWIKRVVLRKQLPGEDFPAINDLEEVSTMLEKRVEHWSKKWMQQGLEQGILQGMEKGMEQGMEKGVEKGKLEGEAAVLERQLSKRFGPLDATIQHKLKTATLEQLEIWTDRILDAARIGDVFGAH